MDNLYDRHYEEVKRLARGTNWHSSEIRSNSDDKPVRESDDFTVVRHPNTIPPTEFMALGLYPP